MERAFFRTILELREEKHEAGRNVATSGQHEEEVNKWPTSRRLNIATLARFSSTIIKSKKGPEFEGIEERTNEGTESRAAATQISGEETYFFYFLLLLIKLLMFYRLNTCVITSSMF